MPIQAKHCLLVVDDEPGIVESLSHSLRRDYQVLGATRAQDAIELVENEDIHIVMTDQRMPEMTGVEFLQVLRKKKPDVVRLLFTGYTDLEVVIDAINQGSVFRYLSKPWNDNELKATLRQASEYFDLQSERRRLVQDLEIANQDLQRANDIKQAFIKVASHELRTPLTIVLGLAELCARSEQARPPLSPWLDQIFQSSLRLNDRIDQMVKLLEAQVFERPLQRGNVFLSDLLHGAAEAVRSFVKMRNQTLMVDVDPNLGNVSADLEKLHDSLVQLLMNAIKFTPDHEILRLVGKRLAPESVEIQVIDPGVGIDPDALPRIFDPFFTGFDVSKHSSGTYEFNKRGLGLGLTVAKAFIEMHGGTLQAKSQVGKGSTFTIQLPDQR